VLDEPGAPVGERLGELAEGARDLLPGGKPDHDLLLMKALRPRNTNNMLQALPKAKPELNAALDKLGHGLGEEDLTNPIAAFEDMRKVIDSAKSNIWRQYRKLMGEQAPSVDTTPVATAIRDSISEKTKLENPVLARRLEKLASYYDGNRMPLDQLDAFRVQENAELNSYYQRTGQSKGVAQRGDPEVAAKLAKADAMRQVLYDTVDKTSGMPGAARELMSRYGALQSVEDAYERTYNVALRQMPTSLSEQLC
jgi:hypothetical protein